MLPALREAPEGLHPWPFDGDVAAWGRTEAACGQLLLAETDPAESPDQIGLRLRFGHPRWKHAPTG